MTDLFEGSSVPEHHDFWEVEARTPYSGDRAKWENDYETVWGEIEGTPYVDRPYRTEVIEEEARSLWGRRNIRTDKKNNVPPCAGRPAVVLLLEAGYPLDFVPEVLRTDLSEVVRQFSRGRGVTTTEAYLAMDGMLRDGVRTYEEVIEATGIGRSAVETYARVIGCESGVSKLGGHNRKYDANTVAAVWGLREAGLRYDDIAFWCGLKNKHVVGGILRHSTNPREHHV